MTARFTTIPAVALLAVIALASSASAQILSYHHRSTVLGDHLGGYAEVLHADGANARNRALAYRTMVRAEREREVLRQEQLAAYHYEQEFHQQQIRQRAAENRRRQELESQQLEQSSQFLLEDVQLKRNVWPKALRQAEFAGYMLQVESILRDWSAGYASDRRALRMISEELRTAITGTPNVNFEDRVDAMQTLKKIEHLAHRRETAPVNGPRPEGHGNAGPQLAKR